MTKDLPQQNSCVLMKTIRLEQAVCDGNRTAAKPDGFDVVDLGPFDNNHNDVLGLNDSGQCAGVCLNRESGRIEAFRQAKGVRSMLGTLGGSFSVAHALNNAGAVVGASLTHGDENFHGFLYVKDRLYDLNEFLDTYAQWEILQAVAINNNGEIVAVAAHADGDRIVLLKPIR
jgi:probable HAF family extracellular repeat protein